MAIPRRDEALENWGLNANARLTTSPATYGTTAPVAAQFDTLYDAFVLAKNNQLMAIEAGTRSETLTELKDLAKKNLLDFARPLYKQIQANASVTAAAKIELNIVVPDVEPTPVPVPAFAPGVRNVRVNGRLVTIELYDPENSTRKGLPEGVDGATIMSAVAPTPPLDPRAFKYEGSTGRSEVQVLFPESVEPGTQVWLTAFFFNQRKQNGPACNPVAVTINYPASMPMAA